MSDNKFLMAALEYAKRRWKIFPIEPGGCLPVMVGGTDSMPIRFETGGASSNPAKIRAWWKEWPGANIGLAIRESGLVTYCTYVTAEALCDNIEKDAIRRKLPCVIMSNNVLCIIDVNEYIFDSKDFPVIGSTPVFGIGFMCGSYILLPPVDGGWPHTKYEWRNYDEN